MTKKVNLLGITFVSGDENEIINQFFKEKGYVVVPAGPALVDSENDAYFKFCLKNSTVAILDSGFLVILNNLFNKNKIIRFSGLKYFRKVLEIINSDELEKSLWILPNENDVEATEKLLKSKKIVHFNLYVAPQYQKSGPIIDEILLSIVHKHNPKHIFIGLGGGTQERLGYFLNSKFKNQSCIHCIGAAIGFLNGNQVYIPEFIDRIYFGWLWRCFSNPKLYTKRYLKALKLLPIFFKSKNQL